MKHIPILLVTVLMLSACVAVPAGPGGSVITPRPTDPPQGGNPEDAVPAPAGSEPTATPAVTGPIVSTAVGAVSTVDLRDLKTPTPEPLPITSADVTIGQPNFGQSVSLKQGQTLALVLESKNWEAPAYDTAMLAPLPWPGNPPAGMQAWLFHATGTGTTLLTLQTANPPCPAGGPCPERPTFLYEVTVVVTQ
jgi:hypothetical protein